MNSDEKFVYTACPGWGDHEFCAIKTIVRDGKIIRTEKADYTGPEAKQGFICQKGITSGRHPYLPGRLLHPLKRIGKRGEGKWQEVSWDQALDEIASRLIDIRDEYGPEALAVWNLPASVPPSFGLNSLLGARFTNVFGATDPFHGYGIDNGAVYACYFDLGHSYFYTHFDPNLIAKAKYILVWGANPLENQQRVARCLVEARERGAKIVDIGLVFDATAAFADQFVPVKPGSDTALALSLAQVLVAENLVDRQFMSAHTVAPFLVSVEDGHFLRDVQFNYLAWDTGRGELVSIASKSAPPGGVELAMEGIFQVQGVLCKPAYQLLVEHLRAYTPESQEPMTGVPSAVVRQIAREYAQHRPAFLLGILGLRYQNQGQAHRAHFLLGALTGNIGQPGGGVTASLGPSGYPISFNDLPICYPDGIPGKSRIVRNAHFYQQVETGRPYPIKAFLKISGNPVHNCPNRSRWVKKIFPKMDLIVDYDIWMTDTGEFSDYILPDCTSFERMEIISLACYNHIVLQEPAIEPLGEARPPAFLFAELSKRVGLGEYFDKTTEEWLEMRLQSPYPAIADLQPPLTLEQLKKEKMVRAAVPEELYDPFSSLDFQTPSGRLEFYAEQLADIQEALARYTPPLEVQDKAKRKKYPYQFFTGRQRFFMQSLFTDDPWMVHLSGDKPTARMNPLDARQNGIQDGDWVRCFNGRGSVKVIMRLDEAIPPGTVQVWFGWRKRHFREGTYAELLVPLSSPENINALANRWWKVVNDRGKVRSVFGGGESFFTGSWDTLWDCLCDVQKIKPDENS